jgi:hypothetical protein
VLEVCDERVDSERLVEGLIIRGTLRGKVGRQIVIGIPIALSPGNPYLLTPQALPQALQDRDLILDPMHARLPLRGLLHHTATLGVRDHAIEGDLLFGTIEALCPTGILAEELEGLEHRLMLGVRGP